MNTGRRIKRTREKLALTQEDVCKKLNISQPSLSYIERRNDNSFIRYLKFLRTKEVDLNELF